MRQYLILALSGVCIAAAHAMEYGSTSVTYEKNPEQLVEGYSRELCAKAAALPRVLILPFNGDGITHVVCESEGRTTGDVFAKFAAGRLDINYRLE